MSDYFPSLKQIRGMFVDPRRQLIQNVQQIVEGKIARSDKIDVDKAVSDLDQYIEKLPTGKKRKSPPNRQRDPVQGRWPRNTAFLKRQSGAFYKMIRLWRK